MTSTSDTPPGWYHAAGDPPGTQRYWDGVTWQGGPQPVNLGNVSGSLLSGALADPGKRIAARFIDLILWTVMTSAVSAVSGIGIVGIRAGAAIGLSLLSGVLGVAAVIIYETLMVSARGQTIGKQALGIKVVRVDGQPIERADAFKRIALFAVYAVPFLGFLVAFVMGVTSLVMVFSDEKRQALWDKLAETIVVDA